MPQLASSSTGRGWKLSPYDKEQAKNVYFYPSYFNVIFLEVSMTAIRQEK